MDATDKPILKNLLELPCPSCGSSLGYSAEKKKIFCTHCGYTEDINKANDLVVELSLQKTLADSPTFIPEAIGKKVFDCQNCGAKLLLDSVQVKIQCRFCASMNVNVEAFDHKYIQPAGIIPFQIPEAEADEKFDSWIRKGWFHPFKLKSLAAKNSLHGVYIPFWTFDTQTESDYEGQAGYNYYTTETIRTGNNVQTRQVQRTRWEYRSGHLSHFFDDILVAAGGGIKQKMVERILPFRLSDVINFDARFLAGWEAEVYEIDTQEGYKIADQIMDRKINDLVRAAIGGDEQRGITTRSQKFNQTFKHVLLPLWICSYIYMDKTYQFAINGQTGKINGQKPISYVKIAFVVFLFIAFLTALYFWKTLSD